MLFPVMSANACNLSSEQSIPRIAGCHFLFAAGEGEGARAGALAATCTLQA